MSAAALNILYPRQSTPGHSNNNDFNNARNTARGISVAIIVVIVISVVATIGGTILAIFCFMRHRRKQREIREKYGGGIGGGFNYPPSQPLDTAGGVGGTTTGNHGGFTDPSGANPYGYNNYNQGAASQPPGYSEGSQGMYPPPTTHTTPGHY
ncbi:hypothetical protein PQX77_016445 [Marasmius sp. AFHP31]|nr:hypothetical protein PQX77_016445 [Marasmius sp. AFHP31]